MSRWIQPGPEWAELFHSFRRSAWRWECQGTYREPGEREPFRLWRKGRRDDSFLDGWLAKVRGWCAQGKTFRRVRMVTEPPTEYLRWMFEVTDLNVAAGEDIRWISETDARRLGMPGHDFYLLDDERVVIMHFGDDGLAGAEVTSDPAVLAEHQRWRDRVWPVAVPHAQFDGATARSP